MSRAAIATALRTGDHAGAEALLRTAIARAPGDIDLFLLYVALTRQDDRRDEAIRILDHVDRIAPGLPPAAELRATIEYERGGDARPLFEDLLRADPTRDDLRLTAASTHWVQGDRDAALATLTARPDAASWPAGLSAAARIAVESGEAALGERFFNTAHAQRPTDLGLWMTHIGFLASGLCWADALRTLRAARAAMGEQVLFDMVEAQALSELDEPDSAERIFTRLEPISDPGFAIARVRALLRTGRIAEAAALAERFTDGPNASALWPLLGLAWRALGDPRIEWLERGGSLITALDLGLSDTEVAAIAQRLRTLHKASSHPHDQSARGGTQTHGNLFDRTDPQISRLRDAVRKAVRDHIDALPATDPAHPLLGRPRRAFRFAGSWSIRLHGAGFHVPHVHPAGWISSALHLIVPDAVPGDDPAAGWFEAAGAPPELRLALAPLRTIPPRAGTLLLFPSTMWHGTRPFNTGERLTVAFDVVPFPTA